MPLPVRQARNRQLRLFCRIRSQAERNIPPHGPGYSRPLRARRCGWQRDRRIRCGCSAARKYRADPSGDGGKGIVMRSACAPLRQYCFPRISRRYPGISTCAGQWLAQRPVGCRCGAENGVIAVIAQKRAAGFAALAQADYRARRSAADTGNTSSGHPVRGCRRAWPCF